MLFLFYTPAASFLRYRCSDYPQRASASANSHVLLCLQNNRPGFTGAVNPTARALPDETTRPMYVPDRVLVVVLPQRPRGNIGGRKD